MTVYPEIVVAPDPEALAQEAAKRFATLARDAVDSRGRFSVALSGGSTPKIVYEFLAEEPYRDDIPWQHVHLFWGDERCVPPQDPGSNFRLAKEALMKHVPIPEDNVHRVRGELDPASAARDYDKDLYEFFCGPRTRFDLVLLGLGNDGHTASLFPGSSAVREKEHSAVSVEAFYQDRPAHRVTLALPAINAARQVWFLVTGAAKAEIVRDMLAGPDKGLPAQLVRPSAGQLTWLLDAPAASLLERSG